MSRNGRAVVHRRTVLVRTGGGQDSRSAGMIADSIDPMRGAR
jgi:hypothetical protein